MDMTIDKLTEACATLDNRLKINESRRKAVRRKRSWRPSEKAYTLAMIEKEDEALQLAQFCMNSTIEMMRSFKADPDVHRVPDEHGNMPERQSDG